MATLTNIGYLATCKDEDGQGDDKAWVGKQAETLRQCIIGD